MIKYTQKPKTPKITQCECGKHTRIVSDDGDYSQGGGYGFMYRVECQGNHIRTKYCGSRHRAIWRWNNSLSNTEDRREAKKSQPTKENQ